jgi:putative transferase (TIGR04331 family)
MNSFESYKVNQSLLNEKKSKKEFSSIFKYKQYLKKHKTSAELERDAKYIDKKYEQYTLILSDYLNKINSVNYDIVFWKKSLGLGFLRHLTILHDAYKSFPKKISSRSQLVEVLDINSYKIPFDFEDQRHFLNHSHFGQDQLLSIFNNIFFAEYCKPIKKNDLFENNKRPNFLISFFKKCKSYLLGFLSFKQNSELGLLGCFFSRSSYVKLFFKFGFKLGRLDSLLYFNKIIYEPDLKKRFLLPNAISRIKNPDDFDRFFFYSLPYIFPRIFVENFSDVTDVYQIKLASLKKIKIILCEAWISSTEMSIFLALSRLNNIKHITMEHNCFYHPYIGSYIDYVASLSDFYASLGWRSESISNLIPVGSLFPFKKNLSLRRNIKILYVAGPAIIFSPHYSGAYGVDGPNAIPHMEFCRSFFKEMSPELLRNISYRSYPGSKNSLIYNKEEFLLDYLSKIKNFTSLSQTSKAQMVRSRIVVIDYISTAYIESLAMNIPTIVLFNKNTYFLKKEYSDFFKPLIEAGIFQTDPASAANLLKSIKDNPELWWRSESVQNGRNTFLRNNLLSSDHVYKFINDILKVEYKK